MQIKTSDIPTDTQDWIQEDPVLKGSWRNTLVKVLLERCGPKRRIICYRMKNSLDSYFSPEMLINPEGRKIWLYQIIKLLRRGNLKQLLCLTSTGKSHCYGDPEWPLFRYLCVDALSGFGKVSRLFNKNQITKKCNINAAGVSCLMWVLFWIIMQEFKSFVLCCAFTQSKFSEKANANDWILAGSYSRMYGG